jgi:hypothetical protein
LIGAHGQWPNGNFFANSAKDVFVDVAGEKDSDFQLRSTSKFRGKGKDGKDPGADIPRVLSAVSGVE